MGPDDRHTMHAEMLAMIESLVAEYAGVFPAGALIACAARTREHLLRTGVREGLVAATEAAVRLRLARRTPAHAGVA